MKVFIIGNIDAPTAPEDFSAAEARLTTAGHEVINPLRNNLPSDSPAELVASINILQLIGAEAVYLLQGWESSPLSLIEKNVATYTGVAIIKDAPEEDEILIIKQAIQAVMGITFDDIRSRSRSLRIMYARQIYAHHARKGGASLTAIGNEMAHNHTSVLYYLRKYAEDYAYIKDFRQYANEVEVALNGKPTA